MPVRGRLGPQRPQDVHLPGRVVDVVITAHHVRDLHVEIVDDDGEVVGGRTVGADQDQVVELRVLKGDPTLDEVVHHDHPALGIPEPDDGAHALGGRTGAVPAETVVARLLLARHLGAAQFLQALFRAVAVVGLALGDEPVRHRPIAVETVSLIEGPLVVVETKPGHPLEDGVHRLRGGALQVRILDPQDERAPVAAGVQPGEEGGTDTADVEVSGRTGGEARAHGHGGSGAMAGARRRVYQPAGTLEIRQPTATRGPASRTGRAPP